jgi:hypothetical protein
MRKASLREHNWKDNSIITRIIVITKLNLQQEETCEAEVDQMFMEYTQNEYCDTNLSLAVCNRLSNTDAWEYALCELRRRHISTNGGAF